MTLDEAIEHCREKENCSACGQEHKQLRLWLEELRERRNNDQRLTNALEQIDPSDYYKGTSMEGLDPFSRQLRRFDINVERINR